MNIRIENLTFRFGQKILFHNFSLAAGGADENPLMLLGPSGCGKTTLLRLIAGILAPEAAGSVRLTVPSGAGTASTALAASPAESAGAGTAAKAPASAVTGEGGVPSAIAGAGSVSFVFQEPRLLPHLSVLENVALPLENLFGKKAALERARYFLSLCAAEELAERFPAALSGGQQHRVSLARAWAYPAPFILMDEPFQSLDIPLRIQLMDEVRGLLTAGGRFIVAVTHAPREALYLGRRIVALGFSSGGADCPAGAAKIVFDERFTLPFEQRDFVSEKTVNIEKRIIAALMSA